MLFSLIIRFVSVYRVAAPGAVAAGRLPAAAYTTLALALALSSLFCLVPCLIVKTHAQTVTATSKTTTPTEAPTIIPVFEALLGAGVELGGEAVAAFTSTAALDTTAQFGMEAPANCVLMFVTVKADAVVAA